MYRVLVVSTAPDCFEESSKGDWGDVPAEVRLGEWEIRHFPIVKKDGDQMIHSDRKTILLQVQQIRGEGDVVVIAHTLEGVLAMGRLLVEGLPDLSKPVIFTGENKCGSENGSNALRNRWVACLLGRTLTPGIYIVWENKAVSFFEFLLAETAERLRNFYDERIP
jgi:L-asparaginase/Glu-tRNA(Gln) amidotransferase subunit D